MALGFRQFHKTGRPQYRSQKKQVFVLGTPNKVTPILGTPHMDVRCIGFRGYIGIVELGLKGLGYRDSGFTDLGLEFRGLAV